MTKGRMPSVACGPFLLALALSGCGNGTSPTAEENRELNNAAEMLDSAPQMLSNIDENSLGPAEEDSVNTDEPAR